MRNSIRFGLIGAGGIAQSHAQAFRASSLATVSAVVDCRAEAAAALAENLGCQSCTHYEDLLQCAPVDAVLICTPPSTHAEIASHFLRLRVPVLCEKPVATRLDDAIAMVETAHQRRAVYDGVEIPLRGRRYSRKEHHDVGDPGRYYPVRKCLYREGRHVQSLELRPRD